jgi:Ca2+-binding EF-hand superfamily protein
MDARAVPGSTVGVVGIGLGATDPSVARRLLEYDGDGSESPSEAHFEYMEDATLSDTDRDGVISKHEALDLNGDGKVTKFEKARLDADGDGTVTTLEIILPRISDVMAIDTDGDGKLSKHEAFDLNSDGKVSKAEKTILDADRDGAVSPQELWTTLGTASEEISSAEQPLLPPLAGSSESLLASSSSDEASLAEILGRHGVSGPASQALSAELLLWRAGILPRGPSPADAVQPAPTQSPHMPRRDLPVLGLWSNSVDCVEEAVLCTITLVTFLNLGRWLARRFCRRRYAVVVQARPSQAPLVEEGEASSKQPATPTSERVAHAA